MPLRRGLLAACIVLPLALLSGCDEAPDPADGGDQGTVEPGAPQEIPGVPQAPEAPVESDAPQEIPGVTVNPEPPVESDTPQEIPGVTQHPTPAATTTTPPPATRD